jgi:CRP-like cAMP-binding protein
MLGIFDVEHDRPRVRTARALTKVELLALSAEDRLELLEDSFEQTRAVIRRMAARLDELGHYGGQPLEPMQTLAPKDEALPLIERVFTLRDTPAFRRASIQALVSLAPAADEVALGAGEVLFQPGEARGVLYVVVAGCLELTRADGALERYASATLVGGGAALGDCLLRQSVRALTPAVVLRIREEDLYDVMEDHFELARSVMRYLSTEHEQQLEAAEAAQLAVLET